MLYKNHILITCFSFKVKDDRFYRFYFVDIKTDFLHNPLITLETGKKQHPFYADYNEGLQIIQAAADEYLDKNS